MPKMNHTVARSLATTVVAALTVTAAICGAPSGAQDMPTDAPGATASVNGLELYYEEHGSGPPLVMLHGGVDPSQTFGAPLAAMAESHRVIAIHLQGHGLTADVDRPLAYETMADDVAALLDHLEIERASVMGYSLGGGVALQTAIRHPERVDKLVVIGTAFAQSGMYPEVVEAFHTMPESAPAIADNIARSPLAELYPDVDWERLMTKIGVLNAQPYDWSEGVAALETPTLLIFADADLVPPSHIAAFYSLLGGGERDAGLDGSGRSPNQLAVIPGVTHYTLMASPLVTQVASAFLAE